MPSAAGLLRRRLGLENAIAFDLNAACTGFVYGLTVAECMMAGLGRRAHRVPRAATPSAARSWWEPSA